MATYLVLLLFLPAPDAAGCNRNPPAKTAAAAPATVLTAAAPRVMYTDPAGILMVRATVLTDPSRCLASCVCVGCETDAHTRLQRTKPS